MSGKDTNKHQLSCRVGNEIYQEVQEMINAQDSPFESTSEYLYTLVIRDLSARRQNRLINSEIDVQKVSSLLSEPEIVSQLKKMMQNLSSE